jgi:signal recognition particle GTPase
MLEELEEQLVMGDVSIETAGQLIQGLRDAPKRGEVPTDEEAIEVLQDLVASMLGSSDRPLKYAQTALRCGFCRRERRRQEPRASASCVSS